VRQRSSKLWKCLGYASTDVRYSVIIATETTIVAVTNRTSISAVESARAARQRRTRPFAAVRSTTVKTTLQWRDSMEA